MKPLIAFTLAGAVVLTACSRTEPAPDPVRAVRTITVSSQTAGGTWEYAGEVRSRTESRLGFRVGGKIVRRQADLQPPVPGDRDLVILAAAKLGNTRLIDNIEVAA